MDIVQKNIVQKQIVQMDIVQTGPYIDVPMVYFLLPVLSCFFVVVVHSLHGVLNVRFIINDSCLKMQGNYLLF